MSPHPNLYSLPVFTSVPLHNGPALRFLKEGGPAGIGDGGPRLVARDPYADGAVVALSVSGGGMRAGAFTLGVLAELDAIRETAAGESAFGRIDFISSISGGSWAVAAVLADRAAASTAPLADRAGVIESRFARMSDVKVARWAERFIPEVTLGATYASVYRSDAVRPLPFAYFNASLYPSQSPFVFTGDYLRHYGVTSLGDPADPDRVLVADFSLADVPIRYAASASGAVPGYTSAFARTALCADGRASFCFPSRKGGVRDRLQLVDGGLYDNIGYKTALEVGLRDRDRIRHGPATILMVDSADAEAFQTMPDRGKDGGHVLALAMASSFPNQNATFDRLRGPAFEAAGFDRAVLLDFAAASGFDPARHGALLDDLPELAHFAANDVSCYNAEGNVIEGRRRLVEPVHLGTPAASLQVLELKGPDCIVLNFARVGYLHKTTFKYSPYAFRLRYQLGCLVVRMNREAIAEAVFRTRRPTLGR